MLCFISNVNMCYEITFVLFQIWFLKMMSSDEEEDPRVLTAEHVKQLLEKCSKLTNKALGNENPNDNSIEQVINAG